MTLDAKQIGWILAGLVVIGISYYVGFVGWTETKMMAGDQGYGLYEVTTTYPIAGIVGVLAGLGLMGNELEDDEGADGEPTPTDDAAVEPQADATGEGETAGDAKGASGAVGHEDPVCPECGASPDPGAEFCTSCGEALT